MGDSVMKIGRNVRSKGEVSVNTIHIVGLDHFLQNVTDLCWTEDGKKEEKRQKEALADLLRKIIQEADVELIAEEGKLDDSGHYRARKAWGENA